MLVWYSWLRVDGDFKQTGLLEFSFNYLDFLPLQSSSASVSTKRPYTKRKGQVGMFKRKRRNESGTSGTSATSSTESESAGSAISQTVSCDVAHKCAVKLFQCSIFTYYILIIFFLYGFLLFVFNSLLADMK